MFQTEGKKWLLFHQRTGQAALEHRAQYTTATLDNKRSPFIKISTIVYHPPIKSDKPSVYIYIYMSLQTEIQVERKPNKLIPTGEDKLNEAASVCKYRREDVQGK